MRGAASSQRLHFTPALPIYIAMTRDFPGD